MIWLGSLISIMADFGISERLVRTSVYRLANDGWLVSEQSGRKSFYTLTPEGRERFRAATHRIYGHPAENWDGHWCLLLLSGLQTAKRDQVRKECGWLGFGAISTNLMAHPSPDIADLDDTLRRLEVNGDVVIISGHTVHSDDAMRRLAEASWNLPDLDAQYAAFVEAYEPALTAVRKSKKLAPKTAFLIRTLMIQEYRKVLLRDPQMPSELLPDGWHGTKAYTLCRELYRRTYERADDYLSAAVATIEGPLPPPAADYNRRFGGLAVGA